MTSEYKTPLWVDQFVNQQFHSAGRMTPDAVQWMGRARTWMKKFLTEEMGATQFVWNKMHYEWSCFAKIGDQWWYFNSGDCRFKIMMSLLVRTAKHEKDFTGGGNQWVPYDNDFFEHNLKEILTR